MIEANNPLTEATKTRIIDAGLLLIHRDGEGGKLSFMLPELHTEEGDLDLPQRVIVDGTSGEGGLDISYTTLKTTLGGEKTHRALSIGHYSTNFCVVELDEALASLVADDLEARSLVE